MKDFIRQIGLNKQKDEITFIALWNRPAHTGG